MKQKYIIAFLIWMVLLNWPVVLMNSADGDAFFIILLFYINIPAHLGLAALFGESHFTSCNYGIIPDTTFAWVLIVLFWSLIAAGLMALTVKITTIKKKTNPTRSWTLLGKRWSMRSKFDSRAGQD